MHPKFPWTELLITIYMPKGIHSADIVNPVFNDACPSTYIARLKRMVWSKAENVVPTRLKPP
jgi:hypothetical protein